jgi:uncharacterized protein YndB with AHSA1/START domain
MTVTDVTKDAQNNSMTITAEFDAPVDRVWELWSDPRKLERWWGPPTYPATMVDHTLEPKGRVYYYMTGPEGDRYHGWWRVISVAAPHRLEFQEGFAHDDGSPDPDMPVSVAHVELEPDRERRTRMTIRFDFESAEAMDQVLAMGMEEGLREAVGQIDALLLEVVNR